MRLMIDTSLETCRYGVVNDLAVLVFCGVFLFLVAHVWYRSCRVAFSAASTLRLLLSIRFHLNVSLFFRHMPFAFFKFFIFFCVYLFFLPMFLKTPFKFPDKDGMSDISSRTVLVSLSSRERKKIQAG